MSLCTPRNTSIPSTLLLSVASLSSWSDHQALENIPWCRRCYQNMRVSLRRKFRILRGPKRSSKRKETTTISYHVRSFRRKYRTGTLSSTERSTVIFTALARRSSQELTTLEGSQSSRLTPPEPSTSIRRVLRVTSYSSTHHHSRTLEKE